METIIILTVFLILYKISTLKDKTDSQKHEDYKIELINLYKLKKQKNE